MNSLDLKRLLQSSSKPFFEKLKYAGLNELEYWNEPWNLPRSVFKKYLKQLDETKELKALKPYHERDGGKYGKTGLKWVFSFEDDMTVAGKKIKIYVKGFFFEINDLRGVVIQSFREKKNLRILSN